MLKRLLLSAFLLLILGSNQAQAATLIVYPNSHAEVTSMDGFSARSGVNENFETIRAGAGNLSGDNNSSEDLILFASTTSNQFQRLKKLIVLYDTSDLTEDVNILSATVSFRGTSKSNGLGSPDFHVVSSTPASNTAVANADYSQVGSDSFGSIPYASFSTTGYNDITMDADGIDNISKSEISKFGARLSWDINGAFGGAWVSGQYSGFSVNMADNTGTTADPKLTITYSISTFIHRAIIIQ
jgi:hypothetical protein